MVGKNTKIVSTWWRKNGDEYHGIESVKKITKKNKQNWDDNRILFRVPGGDSPNLPQSCLSKMLPQWPRYNRCPNTSVPLWANLGPRELWGFRAAGKSVLNPKPWTTMEFGRKWTNLREHVCHPNQKSNCWDVPVTKYLGYNLLINIRAYWGYRPFNNLLNLDHIITAFSTGSHGMEYYPSSIQLAYHPKEYLKFLRGSLAPDLQINIEPTSMVPLFFLTFWPSYH